MNIIIDRLKVVSNVEQLKEVSAINDIIIAIEKEIYPLKVNATTYEDLFGVIKKLRNHWDTFQEDVYFRNKSLRYIFALNYMEGKKRNEIIGLTNELYDDECKAKNWYKSIIKIIHPDINQDQKDDAEKAMTKLNEIYERIKDSFTSDEEE